MAKNHARERNKPFFAKTKVSAFANFEVGRWIKKKKKEKSVVLYVIVAVHFTYFESFVYKNTCRPCYMSEKPYNSPVREF